MTYLKFLDACSKFCASRLYAHLIGLVLSIFFVAAAIMVFALGWLVAKDPERSGEIVMTADSIRSWILACGTLLLAYFLVAFLMMVVALRRYWTCRSDHRPFSVGAYMLFPVFPLGTIFSVYAIHKLRADNES